MKRKGIVLIVIVFMALVFQYANSDVCRAAGKKTASEKKIAAQKKEEIKGKKTSPAVKKTSTAKKTAV